MYKLCIVCLYVKSCDLTCVIINDVCTGIKIKVVFSVNSPKDC